MVERVVRYWEKERSDIISKVVVFGGLFVFIVFGVVPWAIGICQYIKWFF